MFTLFQLRAQLSCAADNSFPKTGVLLPLFKYGRHRRFPNWLG